MKYLIYGLLDPRTEELRYIGRSSSGLTRPSMHWVPSKIQTDKTHKGNWIRSLLRAGLLPKITVLETFRSATPLNEAEQKWIQRWKTKGAKLTNGTIGGEGITGWKHTPEAREKIRLALIGRPMSEKARQTISKAMRTRVVNSDTRARMSAATKGISRPRSPEHQDKLNNAQKGRTFNPEHIAKLSAASRKRYLKLGAKARQLLTLPARTARSRTA